MHSEDGDDDTERLSDFYGIWPTVIGLVLGGGLTWFMFAFSDGFA